MQDNVFSDIPVQYETIALETKKLSFNMASDLQTGSLLKTLVTSKKSGRILELGTGSGLATSWMLQGLNDDAHLTTIENNEVLLDIAKQQLQDNRIDFVLADGYEWLKNYNGEKFDLIFADAMPGKYDLFDETIALLKIGGFYIIDDMLPQPNWPDGHAERVEDFINKLENRKDLTLTKLNWSTGIIIATKNY
ncbi:MAG TPA: methyltransferase domain-containing protein [Puia sp.]|nr:methyltransferase domain-containing protein [Puia sp.]